MLRGQRIDVPGGKVRPTQDRVRQALFSSLGDRVPGCRFLDLFAGSGAVGLDAWSRGARQVCWVEADGRTFSTLRENIARLCGNAGAGAAIRGARAPEPQTVSRDGGGLLLVRADALRFLEEGDGPWDVIFADPPYGAQERSAWAGRIARAAWMGTALAPQGLMIIEQRHRQVTETVPGWQVMDRRTYGDTELLLLARLE